MIGRWPGPATDDAAGQIVRALASGRASATEMALEMLRVADRGEAQVSAFTVLDPDVVLRDAATIDELAGADLARHPLAGLPVAVKDIIDTADLPTAYGSPIYAGHRPTADAAVVHRLRAAGAVPFGKTTTTEFALFAPTATRNPWDLERTPGGSSSGSAAAVAAGSVPVALGTQTAGSVIRPASFNGVVGFKPTHGTIDSAGVKDLSPTFDTVGILARSVPDIALVYGAVADAPEVTDSGDGPPVTGGTPRRLAVFRTGQWDQVEPVVREAFDAEVARIADREGWEVSELPWSTDEHEELSRAQSVLMEVEALAALGPEYHEHRDLCSPQLVDYLDRASTRSGEDAEQARATITRSRESYGRAAAGFAGVLTPAAHGVAPPRATTGDPWFSRAWTALGGPTISLPLLRGEHGLPVGLQLAGHWGRDRELLALASDLMPTTH